MHKSFDLGPSKSVLYISLKKLDFSLRTLVGH